MCTRAGFLRPGARREPCVRKEIESSMPKKVLNILSTVFVWVIVAITVCVMIFTIVSVNTFDRNDRDVFGYKAFIVLSDSMSATDFDAGDLVLVKEVDPTTLKEGDIIAFISQDSENYGVTVTHKIRSLTVAENGDPGFITYGTTTNTDDAAVVTYPFILGKYQFHLANVGTFFNFLKTPQGYIACILIPFLLLIIYQGVNCVKIFRQYKAEQMAELQAEKDAVEAERKKSEAMMAELQALKEQMQNSAPSAPAQEPAPAAETQNVDVAAMMAELQALKAQLAGSAQQPAPQAPAAPELDDILKEFGGQETEN